MSPHIQATTGDQPGTANWQCQGCGGERMVLADTQAAARSLEKFTALHGWKCVAKFTERQHAAKLHSIFGYREKKRPHH